MSRPPYILLVEDNEANVHLVRFLLEHAGARVVHVGNGLDCLAVVEREPPDLILMDLQMPQLDGFETARRLQDNDATRAIPLIASSAYAQPEDEQRAKDCGFVDYISKPFDPDSFASRVRRHLPAPEGPAQGQ